MALTYSFYTDRQVDISEIKAAISIVLRDARYGSESYVDPGLMPIDKFTIETIHTTFGFTPHGAQLFRLDKFAGNDFAFKQLIKTCLSLIENGTSNAVLIFDGEATVFLLKDGKLTLNDSRHFWEEKERLDLLNREFNHAPLPDLG